MKGDFSRLTFRARKHYSGVLHQQGRVWLDADWNEDVADRQYLADQETIDVIGRAGAPEPGTGFQIAPPDPKVSSTLTDFVIGGGPGPAGHFYVDGLLCQLEAPVTYLTQPDYPNPAPITLPPPGQSLTALVYLEAWQRHITYLEDPEIREVALGGPDTATRVKTVAQVKVVPVDAGVTCATAALPTSGQGTLTTLQPTLTAPTDPCRLPDPAAYTGRENHLYRVEIHDPGDVLGGAGDAQTILLTADVAAGAVSLTLPQALSAAQADALQRSRVVLLSDDDGAMDRIPLAGISTDNLTISLSRGVQIPFRAARNARITIGAAHFKWSRDNAAFAVSVTAISADRKTLTVATLGRDQATALRLGDIVEISDDVSDLGSGAGHLTYLSANPDPDLLTVSLADALPAGFSVPGAASPPNPAAPDRHLILRRWDGIGTAASAFDAAATPDLNLGDGVHIQFGGEDLRAGDYWQFAARSIDGSIEALTNAPPAGIVRHRAALAIVRWNSAIVSRLPGFQVLEDCRKIFPPLTSLYEPGFHVTGVFGVNDNGAETPLDNDTVVDATLVSGGIRVRCDSPVDINSIDRPTCFVTVESPVPAAATGVPAAYQQVALRATVGAANQFITWAPTAEARSLMSSLPAQIPANDPGVLARLTLKGNFIWDQSTPPRYLDGEVLGVRASTNTTALKLPSGDRRRGGDFEMWFWLARQAPPLPLTFTFAAASPVQVRGEGITELLGDLVLTGTGGTPTAAGTPVPLVNVQIFFNAGVTSPILTAPQQDAILLIDDPTRLNSNPAANLAGAGGAGLDFKGGAAPNIFVAQGTGGNSISFLGIPLDPPGRNAQRILRIKNVRVNATAILSSTGGVSQISAAVNVTGPIAVPVNPTTVAAGFIQQSAAFQIVNPTGGGTFVIFPANGVNVELAANNRATSGVISVRLRFRELIPTAFRIQSDKAANAVDGPSPAEEEGFDNQGTGALPVVGPALPNIGRASNATRFLAVFDKVPAGVQIFVTTRDLPPAGIPQNPPDNPPPKAILIRSDASGTGGGPGPTTPGGVPVGTGGSTAGIPIDAVPITNNAGVAVWEWVSKEPVSPTTVETLEFGVLLAMRPTPSAPIGTAVVTLSLAPVSNVSTASPSAPVPRFLRTTSAQPFFVVTNPIVGGGGVIGNIGNIIDVTDIFNRPGRG